MTQALHEVNLYSRIDGSGYRNIWVVGDLHGCCTLLMNELHRVDFDPAQDLLISVGDLIDRGTENVECLELLQMPWFRAVMGNHERLMLDAVSPDGNVNNWLMNGGQWFFMLDTDQEILARALVELVKRLPYIIELNTGHETIVIAHADYPGGEYQFGKDCGADMTEDPDGDYVLFDDVVKLFEFDTFESPAREATSERN